VNIRHSKNDEPEPRGVNMITWACVYHDSVKLKYVNTKLSQYSVLKHKTY